MNKVVLPIMTGQSQAERLYEELIGYISTTPVLPGEALPSERKLAEQFKASRNSVREALRMLQIRNFVEVRKGSGCYVKRPYIADTTMENCTIQIDCIDSAELLANQLEARSILVPRMIELAMNSMSEATIERLEGILVRLSRAILARNFPKILEEDTLFYRTLTETTGNRLLVMLYRTLELTFATTVEVFSRLQENEINELFSGYVGIMNALRKNESKDIEVHVQKTVKSMRSHVTEIIPAQPARKRAVS